MSANGDGPPFGRDEYMDRLQRTRERMSESGIDVLLVTDPANMNYLTGYDAWSFYVHQMLVIDLDGDLPLWVGRESDKFGVPLTTYLERENVLGYPEVCIESIDNHAMTFVAGVVAGRVTGLHAHVGVEMEAYYYTARCHETLQRALPDAQFVDATGLVNRVRLVKSPQEITYIRQAGRIVEKAMQVAIEHIEPGARQNDAVGAICQAQFAGFPEYGGEYTAIVPLLPTGIYSAAPHITWSDRTFQADQGTIVEIAGCRKRYHCPLARTVYLGTPSQRVLDTEKAVVEGVAAALDAARPGALAEEVEAAWRRSISEWGVVKESRLGYSIGIAYPPDWGEHSVSLRPGERTPLETNMTFHLMPGLWYEDWGIEISQPFRVAESGAAEALTSFPRELIVKA